MSPQQMMEQPQKRKKKREPKLVFDPAKTVEPAEDIVLDEEMARYKAKKGQGGDRRRR